MTADYLELSLGAERWIATLQRSTDHGVAWSHSTERPEVVSHTLYNGSAGILLFYLELHAATGQQRYLDVALAAADDLAAYARATPVAIVRDLHRLAGARICTRRSRASHRPRPTTPPQPRNVSTVCARARTRSAPASAGSNRCRSRTFTASKATARSTMHRSAPRAPASCCCTPRAPDLHPNALQWATEVGDRLLEVAQRTEAGLNWALMSDMPFPWNPANFAHGGAGVGAFMAMLYEATGHQRFLDAAKGAAAHLMHIAHEVGDGHLVHHHDGDGANLYYLSACHGPPGTTRLFHVLHRITGDATYSTVDRRRAARTAEHRCAGDAFGRLLEQRRSVLRRCRRRRLRGATTTGRLSDARYLDLARREAAVLAARGVPRDGGLCWPQAEHRERPKFIQTQTGYMQGAAGIGSFFIHLHTTLAGAPVKIAFPDTPF